MAEVVTLEDIITTVTGLVASEFGTAQAALTPDLDLTVVEGADSVKVLRAIAQIERIYDIELEDEQVFGCKTIQEVAESVTAAIAERDGR